MLEDVCGVMLDSKSKSEKRTCSLQVPGLCRSARCRSMPPVRAVRWSQRRPCRWRSQLEEQAFWLLGWPSGTLWQIQ